MKSFASLIFILLLTPALAAPQNALLIEDMTWTEVRDAIAAGKTTAIYYAASTEQNGPGVALGKHVFIAHYLSQKIAGELGNALVYPTMKAALSVMREADRLTKRRRLGSPRELPGRLVSKRWRKC